MTREEAKQAFEENRDLINVLYDSFELRTCDNCKLCDNTKNDGTIPCEIAFKAFYDFGYSLNDFGCNKFQEKDEV